MNAGLIDKTSTANMEGSVSWYMRKMRIKLGKAHLSGQCSKTIPN